MVPADTIQGFAFSLTAAGPLDLLFDVERGVVNLEGSEEARHPNRVRACEQRRAVRE